MKFWEFYRIICRRKLMIAGLMVVTLAAIYLSTADEKPYYQATVRMMPSDSALYRSILPAPSLDMSSLTGESRTGSQLPNLMSLITSHAVATRTIRATGFKEEPERLINRIEVSTAPNPGARSRQEAGTDIIEITISDLNPTNAVRTVNVLAHVFANFYQEISHQEAADNRKFLESELIGARRELERASERLKSFKSENRITTVEDASGSAMARFRETSAERDAARASLAEAQAKLREIDNQLRRIGPTRTVEEGTSNTPMVQQLERQLAEITGQLNSARAKYEDVHPQVVALKSSIAEVQANLQKERGKIGKNVSVIRNPVYEALLQERAKLAYERDGLAAKAGQIEASAGRASAELKPGVDVNLARLENEFQTAQTTYNNVQTRLTQARINEKETTGTGAIRIVDEAMNAKGPLGASRLAYLLLGAMLSLVLGAGLAITLDSLDNRIRTNLDVEQLFGTPATALIPSSTESGSSVLARVTYTDPLSPLAEAYRFLRTDLLLSTQPLGAKTIMVATAKPGQGGTVTAANLAISLAMDGKRVVLVDADMRRPCLHRFFKASNEFGLSNILSNERDLEEVMVSTEIENLFLIPAGPTPSNPSELLGSQRMKLLTQQLAENSDYVLFDTPSAIAFTDSVVLSQVVDGVLMVVRAQQVARGAELQVRNLLNKANARIIGVVLNDAEPESVDSYYYHSHYYPDVSIKKEKRVAVMASEAHSLPSTSEPE